MTPAFEFAPFTVRDGAEAAMLAERPAMIEALRQACRTTCGADNAGCAGRGRAASARVGVRVV
jgi:hypothetical protein